MLEDIGMDIACVILNYNTPQLTMKLAGAIHNYDLIKKIVIVDNNSTDKSIELLRNFILDKVVLIQSKHNGGYGYGNNCGIRYVHENTELMYCLILNPDIVIDENNLNFLVKTTIEAEADIAAGSPLKPDGACEIGSWSIPTPLSYVFTAISVLNKLNSVLFLDETNISEKRSYEVVDCVAGCLVLLNIRHNLETILYDENMFLYCEETVLGIKAKKNNLKTIKTPICTYHHMHSQSISETYKTNIARKQLLLKSRLYVLKNYMNVPPVFLCLARVVYFLSKLEAYVISFIRGFMSKVN